MLHQRDVSVGLFYKFGVVIPKYYLCHEKKMPSMTKQNRDNWIGWLLPMQRLLGHGAANTSTIPSFPKSFAW